MTSTLHIVIVGGGYSAVTFTVQLFARLAPLQFRIAGRQVHLTIIEPREQLGRGLAYSSADPDHRINAPSFGHAAIAGDQLHFHNWFLAQGGLEQDPQSASHDLLFPRRADFGRYLGSLVEEPMAAGLLTHCRDQAQSVRREGNRLRIETLSGAKLAADHLVIATGHAAPATPRFVDAPAASHPKFMASAWDATRVAQIQADDRVLLLGSGLTAADMIASLLRREHRAEIEVISRRGLRPQPLPAPTDPPMAPIWDRLKQPIPTFLLAAGQPPQLRSLLRALRDEIARRAESGVQWYEAFDDLRDALYRLWPALTDDEQRQYLRHLKPWYETYRFRMPPQTGKAIADAQATGRLHFQAARVLSLKLGPAMHTTRRTRTPHFIAQLQVRSTSDIVEREFDAVINCTGPSGTVVGAVHGTNVFIDALLAAGLVRPHACGLGLDVSVHLRAINQRGEPEPLIRVIGPPTAGAFGDPIGAVFICAQIDRMMPDFIAGLH